MRKSKAQHMPLFREYPGSKSLVVFIHGFMGSPRQFAGLVEVAYREGHSVAALLLPGHGGSAKYFGTGSFELWQGHVDSEIERFSQDFSSVLLVGHSMGGWLAINAAVRFHSCVRGVFLLATPFKRILFSFYALRLRFRQFFSRRDDPLRREYFDNCSVALTPNLILTSFRPSAELKRCMSVARGNLPLLSVPVFAVFSSADELVSLKSVDILRDELGDVPLELVLLSGSTHVLYSPSDRAEVEREFFACIVSVFGA